jgi:hypothetical protein
MADYISRFQTTSTSIADDSIVNADINSAAAIAGTKINPNFGSQIVLAGDGTVGAPGLSFSGDSNTGIYRIGSDNLGFSAGGAKVGEYSSVGAWTLGPTSGATHTVNGNLNVTGNGQGIIPRGAIIAIFPHLSAFGAYTTSATTVPDANGFVLCQGQTLTAGVMIGAVIPNINNSVFLRGSSTSGGSGGSATRTLVSGNIPTLTSTGTVTNTGTTVATNTGAGTNHFHGASGLNYPGSGVTGSVGGSDGTHPHTISDPGHFHTTSATGGLTIGVNASGHSDAPGGSPFTTNTDTKGTGVSVVAGQGGHGHGFSLSASATGITGNTAGEAAHTHPIPSLTVNSGQSVSVTYSNTASSFNIEPTYINAVYIMRVN